MSPRLPKNLTRLDTAALLLILLGLVGMVRHFSARPEPASAPTPQATSIPFTAPPLPRFAGAAEAAHPSSAVQAMRRRLREFVIPWPNIKSLPVSDALALLQHHWQTLPHDTYAIPPATFILSGSAAQQVAAASPPVLVSMEVPGVSPPKLSPPSTKPPAPGPAWNSQHVIGRTTNRPRNPRLIHPKPVPPPHQP